MDQSQGIEDLLEKWDGAYEVDGRVISNIEMMRLTNWSRERRRERIDARDCTDCRGPCDDGSCRMLYGQCVFVSDANRILWESEHAHETRDDDFAEVGDD